MDLLSLTAGSAATATIAGCQVLGEDQMLRFPLALSAVLGVILAINFGGAPARGQPCDPARVRDCAKFNAKLNEQLQRDRAKGGVVPSKEFLCGAQASKQGLSGGTP